MISESLREALETVLACPVCQGQLALPDRTAGLNCPSCGRAYPIKDGIPVFLQNEPLAQEEERQRRDRLASGYLSSDAQTILQVIARHHCLTVMRRHAAEFRGRFKPSQWLLDIGIGWGWHWLGHGVAAKILGVDMSLNNLLLARHLLGQNGHGVVLVCADAAALPIRAQAISGVWSVQVFQHFPSEMLQRVLSELDRILKDRFMMEIYNLNRPLLHKMVYRLFGKHFHCRGKQGEMELNRLSVREWTDIWRGFRHGSPKISHSYSELFFHPDFRLSPERYPVRLERILATYVPPVSAFFARQAQLSFEAG